MKHLIFFAASCFAFTASHAMFEQGIQKISRVTTFLKKSTERGLSSSGQPIGSQPQHILNKYKPFGLTCGKKCGTPQKCQLIESWLKSTFLPKSLCVKARPIKTDDHLLVTCAPCGIHEKFIVSPASDVCEDDSIEPYQACPNKNCFLEGQELMPNYPLQRAIAVCDRCGYMEDIQSNKPAKEPQNNQDKEK